MPTYEIYKRDGTPVRVEGPEGATTKQLIDLHLQQQRPCWFRVNCAQRYPISNTTIWLSTFKQKRWCESTSRRNS